LFGMSPPATSRVVARIADECVAVRTRVISRLVSRIYDEALRPHGIKVTQMNVLVAVGHLGTARAADLIDALAMEQSTVSRALERLARGGWIEDVASSDARVRNVRLSAAGKRLVGEILPAWEKAQREVREILGAGNINALADMARMAGAATP
jgi:DNA-binding MarR family transcriptional regulator